MSWIPSHRGIVGNEKADEAAKSATSLDFLHIFDFPHQDLFNQIKSTVIKEMNQFTDSYGKSRLGRRYMDLHPVFSLTPWFCNTNNSRKTICLLNRIKTFHVKSRHHLFEKNIVNDDLCECGDDIHDIDHLVWSCPLFADARIEFVEWCSEKNIKTDENVCKLTNVLHPSLGLRFAQFIQSCGMDL